MFNDIGPLDCEVLCVGRTEDESESPPLALHGASLQRTSDGSQHIDARVLFGMPRNVLDHPMQRGTPQQRRAIFLQYNMWKSGLSRRYCPHGEPYPRIPGLVGKTKTPTWQRTTLEDKCRVFVRRIIAGGCARCPVGGNCTTIVQYSARRNTAPQLLEVPPTAYHSNVSRVNRACTLRQKQTRGTHSHRQHINSSHEIAVWHLLVGSNDHKRM